MRTDFKVLDAMTRSPISMSKDDSVINCANMMSEKDVGSVLVLEEGKLLGLVTESDIVRKAVAGNHNIQEMKISNIMCTDVTTIEPNVDLFEAISLMAELNIRHLPVVHQSEFLGFLTAKDVLKIEPALFEILIQNAEIREEDSKPVYGEINEIKDYGTGDDEEL
jgi:CBS domain-containing protein